MKARKKKPRLIVLGIGYTWYSKRRPEDSFGTCVQLHKKPNVDDLVKLEWGNTGNWNRVRLLIEVLD